MSNFEELKDKVVRWVATSPVKRLIMMATPTRIIAVCLMLPCGLSINCL